MIKLFREIKSKRFYVRILLLTFVLTVAMFLISFIFIKDMTDRYYDDRIRENAGQMLSVAGDYVDTLLLATGHSMQQLMRERDITAAVLLPDEVDYGRKANIMLLLRNLNEESPLVDGVCLVSYASGTLYLDDGSIVDAESSDLSRFIPEYNSAVTQSKIKGGRFTTILLSVGDEIALIQDHPTPEKNGALLVTLREEMLAAIISRYKDEFVSAISINAKNGSPIYTVGEPEGEPFASLAAGQSGLTYSIYHSGASRTGGLLNLIKMVWLWVLVFSAVSVILALWVTARIYKPIDELSGEAGRPAADGENELQAVGRVYRDKVRENEALSEELRSMSPIVNERLYKNLLLGREVPTERITEWLATYGSPFEPDDRYCVLVAAPAEVGNTEAESVIRGLFIRVQHDFKGYEADYAISGGESPAAAEEHLLPPGSKDAGADSPAAAEEQLITLKNADHGSDGAVTDIKDTEKSHAISSHVLMDDYTLASIICFKDTPDKAAGDASAEYFKSLNRYIGQIGAESLVVCGCGRVCSGFEGIGTAYRDALEDLRWRQYHGSGAENSAKKQSESVRAEMMELAKNGDLKKAEELCAEEVMRIEAVQPHGERLAEYLSLMDGFVNELISMFMPEENLKGFERFWRGAEEADAAEWKDIFFSASIKYITLLADYGQKSRNRYVTEAMDYIKARCTDSRLSLDTVAANVGINSSYLSRLFNESSDVNFVNYVNQCRVERAKILLRDSGMLIQEVGFRSGFNSLQNFNRVFKRLTGITPGAYRKGEKEDGVDQD